MLKKKRPYRVNELSDGWNALFTLIIGVLAVATVLPVVLVLMVSLSSGEDLTKYGYQFIPKHITFGAYLGLIKTGQAIWWGYLVTIFYAFAGTILHLAVTAMFGYVMARREYPLRKFLTMAVFFPTLFGGGLVPTYMLYTQILNIDNTILVFLIPGAFGVFNAIILRTFIQSTIPVEMFDAAAIDGANEFRVFRSIVLPLSKAGLATIALFVMVGKWNEWFTGMLYIENPKLVPVQTMLTRIQQQLDFIKNNSDYASTMEGQKMLMSMPTEQTRMAILVLSTLPIIFAYPFFQRFFIQGLTIGSVKG